MGILNLNVSLRVSPMQRMFIQLENVNTEISITDLKNEIINKGGLEKSCELGKFDYRLNEMNEDVMLRSVV